jgi:hypothetical protein
MHVATVNSLQAARNARKSAQDMAWQDAVRLAKEQKTSQEQQAQTLASEAYVNKRQQERVLPNVMQKAGLNTQGYTETTANNIGTAYQEAVTGIVNKKQEGIAGIDSGLASTQSKISQNKANIEGDYQDSLAAYYQSLQKNSSGGNDKPLDPNTSKTDDTVIGGIGATNAITPADAEETFTMMFTDAKYRRAFWGKANNVDPTLASIRQILNTITIKGGVKLTPMQIDNILAGVGKYWGSTYQREQRAKNVGNAPTAYNNPPMTAVPGVSPKGKKSIPTQ